jgi:hypothetical protein
MIRETKTFEHNLALLDKFIWHEQELAHRLDQREGLVYLYALNYGKTCSECLRVFDGKVFLLYDGRTQVRHALPALPNPSCLKPLEYEGEKECGFSWMHFNPRTQYLRKERQYYCSSDEYLDTWHLQMRLTNEQEWAEWIGKNPEIDLYGPPTLVDSVRLSFFERYCIKHGRVKIFLDGFEVSLKDLGLLSLLTMMQTANVAVSGFGFKLPDLGIDFSEKYDNLENGGKNLLTGLIRKIKFQLSGGCPFKPIDGCIKHQISSLEIHAKIGLTRQSLDSFLRLTESDIRIMSQYSLPTK